MQRSLPHLPLAKETFLRQFPHFQQTIDSTDPSPITFCETTLGELNLHHSVHGPYHDPSGAKHEAERWKASLSHLEKVETIFLYGLGLGYYYEELKPWLKERSKRLLFVLEDDPALLIRLFEVDLFLEILDDPQVLLIPFFPETPEGMFLLRNEINTIAEASFSTVNLFTSLELYQRIKPRGAAYLHTQIEHNITTIETGLSFTEERVFNRVMRNSYRNTLRLQTSKMANGLYDQFQGVPAMICGAGPSLLSQIDLLKPLKKKFLLFAAGTGVNCLNAEGLIPHLSCGIDPHRTSKSRVLTNTSFEVPYFFGMNYHYGALDLLHGPKLWFGASGDEKFRNWLLTRSGLQEEKILHVVVSTTCACLAIAKELGARPIFIAGLDLSYTEKKRYPETITAHPSDFRGEKRAVQGLRTGDMIPAKSIQGNRIFTRPDWLNEGEYFVKFGLQHPEIQLINVTKEGLPLYPLPHLTLEDLEQHLRISFDLENWLHASICLCPNFPIGEGGEILQAWKILLEKGIEKLQPVIYNQALEKDAENERETYLQDDSFKYFFKNLDETFETLAKRDRIPYERHPNLFSQEEIERFNRKLDLLKLTMCLGVAQGQIKLVDEVLQEERPVERAAAVLREAPRDYIFDNGHLLIDEPAIGLYHEETFTPAPAGHLEKKPGSYVVAFNEGLPEGECLLYDKEGWLKGRWYYKAGKLHGPTSFFSQDGTLLARGWFLEDKQVGKTLQFYLSGALCSYKWYKDDQAHGAHETYYENGALKSRLEFREGWLHGTSTLYNPDGRLKLEVRFAQGKRHGKETLWYPSGGKYVEAEYEEGRPIGKTFEWNEEGRLITEITFYDTAEHFDEKRWNSKGEIVFDMQYVPKGISESAQQAEQSVSEAARRLKKQLEEMRGGD